MVGMMVGTNMFGEGISYIWTGLGLRNNRLKFKIIGELPITLEEFMEYTSNFI